MPAISSGKVLVTGANGYIAVWVVKAFLDQGFAVRGTVRSESKATHLRSLFSSFGDKLELVVVEDITKEGAFDAAVQGVDAIAHTASPFHFKAVEPSEIIEPAVQGTTGLLRSALAHAPRAVQRIAVTSSCAAVLTPDAPPTRFSEADWNAASIATVTARGAAAPPAEKYRASKTLAERAAWDFWAAHKRDVAWDLVVLNPPFVYGPVLHEVAAPESLNESMRDWYNTVVKGARDNAALATIGSSYVDVRDLAEAHVRALTSPEASGERIIVSVGPWKWQDFVSIAHNWDPRLPAGNTDYDPAKAVHSITYAPEKQQKLLGVKFRTMEETTIDSLEDFKERGWF